MEFIKIHGRILLKVIIRDTRIYAVRTNIFVSESYGRAGDSRESGTESQSMLMEAPSSCCCLLQDWLD